MIRPRDTTPLRPFFTVDIFSSDYVQNTVKKFPGVYFEMGAACWDILKKSQPRPKDILKT